MTTLHSRKSSGRSPLRLAFLLMPLLLACFWLSPAARAVVPAPDGGYPGFNTAEGQSALGQVAPGVWNTAIGGFALNADITGGTGNTAVGLNALRANTLGDFNSALGVNALRFNVIGINNTAVGYQALFVNTGASNTAVGVNALSHNTTGVQNEAVGQGALGGNVGGDFNAAFGHQALAGNNADDNTAVGWKALVSNTSGGENTAVGSQALLSNAVGGANSAFGFGALANSTAGFAFSNAFGWFALVNNTLGQVNNAFGATALFNTLDGNHNAGFGDRALFNNLHGSFNTAIGDNAGQNITGSGNVCIGQGMTGFGGFSNLTQIRNINTLSLAFSPGLNDYVTISLGTGILGHTAVVSSRRYKENIKPMDKTSEMLYALKPVTFRPKKEFEKQFSAPQLLGFGLIAEDVDKVSHDLVYYNPKGQPESVRYAEVNAMLLNEFLKEHKKVEEQARKMQEQEATITQLTDGVKALTASLKDQAAQIQKVSDQLELSKSAPRTVLNNQ